MSEIITKIDNTVKKYCMLSNGDRVVVGVSGGADSMLLLHYLIGVREKYSLDLIVANVEHGIRGEASKSDSAFVKSFCDDNAVRFEMLTIDAACEAKAAKLGVEEYSRNRRYDFFNSFSPDKIAVAHNMSDSTETVLFRLARGSSVKGLSGIHPVRGNVIRPLIECSSDEIRNACNELGIAYVVDETNFDSNYSRNFIRNVIVPEFEKLNPSFDSAVNRFANSFSEDDSFILKCASECFDRCKNDVGLDISKLKEYDVAVIKRVLQLLADKYDIVIDNTHLTCALELLEVNKKLQIKDNIYFASSANNLRIYRDSEVSPKHILKFEVVSADNYKLNKNAYSKRFDFCADYDKLNGAVFIRSKQDGDSFSPVGRGCTKTLKKLFNEMKIPAENRKSIQVVCDDNGIIAVQGCTVDDRVKLNDETKSVILLNITTED